MRPWNPPATDGLSGRVSGSWAADAGTRRRELQQRREALTKQPEDLARDNQIRDRVTHFAQRVLAIIDQLDFDQRRQLLRLVVDDVRVTGWSVTIQLRIPLDEPPGPPADGPRPARPTARVNRRPSAFPYCSTMGRPT
jgi:hypothetical protein